MFVPLLTSTFIFILNILIYMFKAEFFWFNSYNRFVFRYSYTFTPGIIYKSFLLFCLSNWLASTVNSTFRIYLKSLHFCSPPLPLFKLSHNPLSGLLQWPPNWPFPFQCDLTIHSWIPSLVLYHFLCCQC